jgi:hypothetical protein
MERETAGLAEFASQGSDDSAVEIDVRSIEANGLAHPHPVQAKSPMSVS